MIVNESSNIKKIEDATAISKEIGYNEIAYINNNEKITGEMPVKYNGLSINSSPLTPLPEGDWVPLIPFKNTLVSFIKGTDRALYLNENNQWIETTLPMTTVSSSLYVFNNSCIIILPQSTNLSSVGFNNVKYLTTIDGKNWVVGKPGSNISTAATTSIESRVASFKSQGLYKIHDLIVHYTVQTGGTGDYSNGQTTKNGLTWEFPTLGAPFPACSDYINGIYFCFDPLYFTMVYSYNGVDWNAIELPETDYYPTLMEYYYNKYTQTYVIFTGEDGSGYYTNIIYYSQNLSDWNYCEIPNVTSGDFTPWYFNGIYYVIPNNSNKFYTSSDLQNWSEIEAPFVLTTLFEYNNILYHRNSTIPLNNLYYSIDQGYNWSPINLQGVLEFKQFDTILYAILNTNEIKYTIDGINWNDVNIDINNIDLQSKFNNLIYLNNTYFLTLKYSNILYSSKNGIDWEKIEFTYNYKTYDMLFVYNNQFILLCDNNYVLSSFDGINWEQQIIINVAENYKLENTDSGMFVTIPEQTVERRIIKEDYNNTPYIRFEDEALIFASLEEVEEDALSNHPEGSYYVVYEDLITFGLWLGSSTVGYTYRTINANTTWRQFIEKEFSGEDELTAMWDELDPIEESAVGVWMPSSSTIEPPPQAAINSERALRMTYYEVVDEKGQVCYSNDIITSQLYSIQ